MFIKKSIYVIGLLLLISCVYGATNYVADPSTCPATDATNFPGQSCYPTNICGDIGGYAQCFDTTTITPPTTNTTSSSAYTGSLNGGYLTNCYRTTTCNVALCNRNSTCYSTFYRNTNCIAEDWLQSSCDSCRSGYLDCNTDTFACEIQVNGACGVGNTGTYASVCNVTGSGGSGNCTSSVRLDCNNDDGDSNPATCNGASDGCEILIGGSCSIGILSGTYDSVCDGSVGSCIVSTSHHITGTNAQYSSAFPNLWTTQWGSGLIASFNNGVSNKSVNISNDACIILNDGTEICNSTDIGGSGSSTQTWQNYSNNIEYSEGVVSVNKTLLANYSTKIGRFDSTANYLEIEESMIDASGLIISAPYLKGVSYVSLVGASVPYGLITDAMASRTNVIAELGGATISATYAFLNSTNAVAGSIALDADGDGIMNFDIDSKYADTSKFYFSGSYITVSNGIVSDSTINSTTFCIGTDCINSWSVLNQTDLILTTNNTIYAYINSNQNYNTSQQIWDNVINGTLVTQSDLDNGTILRTINISDLPSGATAVWQNLSNNITYDEGAVNIGKGLVVGQNVNATGFYRTSGTISSLIDGNDFLGNGGIWYPFYLEGSETALGSDAYLAFDGVASKFIWGIPAIGEVFNITTSGALEAQGGLTTGSDTIIGGTLTTTGSNTLGGDTTFQKNDNINLAFDTDTNDGGFYWERAGDRFVFSDDIRLGSGEKITLWTVDLFENDNDFYVNATQGDDIYLIEDNIHFGDNSTGDVNMIFQGIPEGQFHWDSANDRFEYQDDLFMDADQSLMLGSSTYSINSSNSRLLLHSVGGTYIDGPLLPAVSGVTDIGTEGDVFDDVYTEKLYARAIYQNSSVAVQNFIQIDDVDKWQVNYFDSVMSFYNYNAGKTIFGVSNSGTRGSVFINRGTVSSNKYALDVNGSIKGDDNLTIQNKITSNSLLLDKAWLSINTTDGDFPAGQDNKMLYMPDKNGAFRVGRSTNIAWDAGNIGLSSFASGQDTGANGTSATAMGQGSNADGNFATAIGFSCDASGTYSMALGDSSTASGTNSYTLGQDCFASGGPSVAIGDNCDSTAGDTYTFGADATASHTRSMVLNTGTAAVSSDRLNQMKLGASSLTTTATIFEIPSTGKIYLGDSTTDGTVRIGRTSNSTSIDVREEGVFRTKIYFHPNGSVQANQFITSSDVPEISKITEYKEDIKELPTWTDSYDKLDYEKHYAYVENVVDDYDKPIIKDDVVIGYKTKIIKGLDVEERIVALEGLMYDTLNRLDTLEQDNTDLKIELCEINSSRVFCDDVCEIDRSYDWCEQLYVCDKEEPRTCESFSAPNKETGLISRCYYDDTYDVCYTGWRAI